MIIENKLMEKEIKLMEKEINVTEVIAADDERNRSQMMLFLLHKLVNCNKDIRVIKGEIKSYKDVADNMLEIICKEFSGDIFYESTKSKFRNKYHGVTYPVEAPEGMGTEFYGYEFAKGLIKIDGLKLSLKTKQEELVEIKRKMKRLQKNRVGLKQETKICSKCKIEKEAFDFNGESYWCKECCKEYNIEYSKNNPEKIYAARQSISEVLYKSLLDELYEVQA